jgi:NitT/TauT family transport system substrate-binding protein
MAESIQEEATAMKKVMSEISGTVFSLPWLIAKDQGLFEAEGIDMEFVRARPSGAVTHTENPDEVNPILGHVAFEEARVSIYRA